MRLARELHRTMRPICFRLIDTSRFGKSANTLTVEMYNNGYSSRSCMVRFISRFFTRCKYRADSKTFGGGHDGHIAIRPA